MIRTVEWQIGVNKMLLLLLHAVFSSSVKEMDYVLSRSGEDQPARRRSDAVVRLRGLPYQCTKDDIRSFFTGKESV